MVFGLLTVLITWQPCISYGVELDSIVVISVQQAESNPELSAQMAQIVSSVLKSSGWYNVVSPVQAQQLLKKKGVAKLASCSELKCLRNLGRELSVDKVVTGIVSKAGNGYQVALKVFDVERRKIVASGAIKVDYPSEQFKYKLENLTNNIIKKVPIKGRVIAVSAGKVSLDVGANAGLKVGKMLRVKRLKEVKAGSRVLFMGETLVGEIRIVRVDDEQAEAEVKKSNLTLREGDLVEVKGYSFTTAKPEVQAEVAVAPVVTPPAQPKPQTRVASISVTPPVKVESTPEPEQVPQAEPEEAPVLTTGILTIITDPPKAKIIFDGEDIGYSPKTIPDLKIGTHDVKLIKQAYRDWAGEVVVKVGAEKKLKVDLVAYGGTLNISSIPTGATIVIGKKNWGKTNKSLKFPPGSYLVKLVKRGYNSSSKRVKLVNGAAVDVSLILTKSGVSQVPGMIYIPEGEFVMGTANGEQDERPAHRVNITGFYIDKQEVNNGDYRKFLETSGRRAPDFWDDTDLNKPDLPVVGVTWEDATAYCRSIGKRLPTEAEWEKAARGIHSRKYPWGNGYESRRANAYGKQDGYQFTAPVKSFASGASPFGVLNMAGNVWEWCADWYAEDYYTRSPKNSPKGPKQGQLRVIRGGSWEDAADKLRTTNRYAAESDYSSYNLGFRCAK
jgi:iron(II)-dependent oxidoreductase